MKTLVVHVGTAKTGTTALQRYLYDNNNLLKKNGWYYMDWNETEVSKEIIMECRRGYENGAIPLVASYGLWSEEQQKCIWGELEKKLQQYNVIISEECIWDNTVIGTEQIIQYFKSYYRNIKVIVYLRRQDIYGESLWNQGVKEYVECRSVTTHIENNNNRYYLNKLEKIENVIGKENIIIRIYEKGQLVGGGMDVCTDFIDALGMEVFENAMSPQKLNLRIDGDLLEIKRYFNEIYTANKGKDIEPLFEEEFSKVNSYFESDNSGTSFLSEKEQLDMIRLHSEENSEIARRYLGRDNGELFKDNSVRDSYILKVTDREKKLIELFAKIIALQSTNRADAQELALKEKENLSSELKNVLEEKDAQSIALEALSKEKKLLDEEFELVLKEKDILKENIAQLECKLESRTIKGVLKMVKNLFIKGEK